MTDEMIGLWLAAAIVLVGAFVFAVRRAPAWVWVLVFGGGALLLPFLWYALEIEQTIFRVVKVFSLGIACLSVAAIRSQRFEGRWLPRAIWVILALNILEACLAEAFSNRWMNPLAGTLLLLGIAGPSHIAFRRGEAQWDLGWPFVLAYTLWNFTFIYCRVAANQEPGPWIALSIVHLGVPLLMTGGHACRWIEARVIALFMTVAWGSVATGEPWIYAGDWYHTMVDNGLQIASLVCVITVLSYQLLSARAPTSPMRWLGRHMARAHGG